jgi:hypothetical protein
MFCGGMIVCTVVVGLYVLWYDCMYCGGMIVCIVAV